MRLQEVITERFHKTLEECSNQELYCALLELVKRMSEDKEKNTDKKKLYYISAEFLTGKLLSNNLINLGIYNEIKRELKDKGKSLSQIEELEPEPSLGNDGLGRLAACFLDSIATLGLPGDGIGLNYHYGLFKQEFDKNLQKEVPNPWIEIESWLKKTDTTYEILFGGFTVTSRLYDIDVVGYQNRTNKLHLFDIETIDETIVRSGIDFEKEDIQKNLTLFLYPDDSDDAGRLLRVYQQYFMVSNAARLILDEASERGSDFHDLADYVVIQINDTHPTLIIPELIRLLMKHGIVMEEAITIVRNTCAYTNHTILAEALEKWPIWYLEKVVPQLMPIIRQLDNQVRKEINDESTYIIKDNFVHMAHIDIHYGFSVNGVAYLHTKILKNNELNHFYRLYPEKFNNKTNGITFRRWLLYANPELCEWIESLIGNHFQIDAMELEKLGQFKENPDALEKLLEVKRARKLRLKKYLKETQQVDIDEDSIFDIQIKRLHEYKRQQMNALYVIHKYFSIKEGNKPTTPITVFFGAKAGASYTIAKDIIHLILCLQEFIAMDEEVSPYLKVIMVENYNVTAAEKLIPACDIDEQISLASKEASGTGNMKFMLNGAVTIGTMDGANVEIAELVEKENIYIFGESAETIIAHYEKADYIAEEYYKKDADIKRAVDFIISEEIKVLGNQECLERLHYELISKDRFMTLLDWRDYMKTKEKMFQDYEKRMEWAKKMLINISKAGFFSSDRTIAQYNEDIWKLS